MICKTAGTRQPEAAMTLELASRRDCVLLKVASDILLRHSSIYLIINITSLKSLFLNTGPSFGRRRALSPSLNALCTISLPGGPRPTSMKRTLSRHRSWRPPLDGGVRPDASRTGGLPPTAGAASPGRRTFLPGALSPLSYIP